MQKIIKMLLNKLLHPQIPCLKKHLFHEMRCKITTFYSNNQIFFVLLPKIFNSLVIIS